MYHCDIKTICSSYLSPMLDDAIIEDLVSDLTIDGISVDLISRRLQDHVDEFVIQDLYDHLIDQFGANEEENECVFD